MLNEIKTELINLEQIHDIKILYAVESGSRAWGFESTDSDWDVRFIYIHRKNWYLEIDEKKDSMETILPNDIDLAGWEMRKALKLFRKSNPPMLEWLQSPIVYLENDSTASQLRELSKIYFSPRSCMHHYLSMASGNYQNYLQKDIVRLKKYFYALRPVLACDWIRAHNSMPPVKFQELLETQIDDAQLKGEIENLLKRKMQGDELKEEPRIQILNEFLEEKLNFYNHYVKDVERNEQANTEKLNILFRETLERVWE